VFHFAVPLVAVRAMPNQYFYFIFEGTAVALKTLPFLLQWQALFVFFADTEVILLGSILPRSDIYFCNNLTFL